MFFAPASPGVANGTPFGSANLPSLFLANARNPESSTSNVAFGKHQLPIPCFGNASEQNGERGERYSFWKICVTLSLKSEVSGIISRFAGAASGFFQSKRPPSP